MKAATRRKYGPPSIIQIEDTAKPIPTGNELLVRVTATTVNRTDCANLTAKPFVMRFVQGMLRPKRPTMGTDFAGVVEAVGEGVRNFSIGDAVFGFNDLGLQSQATYCIVPEAMAYQKPDNIDFNQAAASVEGAHYAYTFIQKTNIKAGQKVLINGATGAIGSALLQFVRRYDVHISATADTDNIDIIRSLGADTVIDYTREDILDTNVTYDYVFDAVGKSTFGKCKSILTKKGIYISSEPGPYIQNVFYALLTNWFGSRTVIFPIPYPTKESIPFIIQSLEEGGFKPLIDRIYPLEKIAAAYAYVLTGKKTGNVLISMT